MQEKAEKHALEPSTFEVRFARWRDSSCPLWLLELGQVVQTDEALALSGVEHHRHEPMDIE